MRTVAIIALITLTTPAAAGGPAAVSITTAWTALPSTHFSPWTSAPTGRVLAARTAPVPAGVLREALASAADANGRRDIVLDEMAQGWEPARRSALEDLRDAQRAFAAAAGGDHDARGKRFVALLKQVVDDNGRSVAREPSGGDTALSQTYDRVIREAPDDRLATIQVSQTAWIAYRDAFDRFAQSMDRPDAAKTVRDDLARLRANELGQTPGQ